MDIQRYLERISYAGPVDISLETLSNLQRMHLLHVPFENLDIHNHTRIDLKNLFDKVVTRNRGGFCYELNGLFHDLLKEIGFNVKMISARVYDGKGNYSPEFDHMGLIVRLGDKSYLVDVGFGEFTLEPIEIALGKETVDPRGIFSIASFDGTYKVVKKSDATGDFIPEYLFSELERRLEEFDGMCNYHQTSSESHFMKKRVCSLPTETGRITLTGDTLKITENGEVKERKLNDAQEIQEVLWDYFGVNL